MATCQTCKKSHFGMLEIKNGECPSCRKLSPSERQERVERSNPISPEAQRVMLTTETTGIEISERLGIIVGEGIEALGVLKEA